MESFKPVTKEQCPLLAEYLATRRRYLEPTQIEEFDKEVEAVMGALGYHVGNATLPQDAVSAFIAATHFSEWKVEAHEALDIQQSYQQFLGVDNCEDNYGDGDGNEEEMEELPHGNDGDDGFKFDCVDTKAMASSTKLCQRLTDEAPLSSSAPLPSPLPSPTGRHLKIRALTRKYFEDNGYRVLLQDWNGEEVDWNGEEVAWPRVFVSLSSQPLLSIIVDAHTDRMVAFTSLSRDETVFHAVADFAPFRFALVNKMEHKYMGPSHDKYVRSVTYEFPSEFQERGLPRRQHREHDPAAR